MSQYLAYLEKVARELGIPAAEARAIYERESSSGRNVRNSPAGAIGHMQLMPGTAKELGVNPNNPYENIRGGLTYYAQQRKRFGDPALAAAAYNAGPGRVQRAGNRVPNIRETQDYVAKFLKQIGGTKTSQPAPTSAITPQVATTTQQAPMDEDIEQTAGGLGALSAVDDARALRPEYVDWLKRSQGLSERQQAQRAAMFEQGQQNIQQMYGGPTTGDTLLSLSQALLSPRRYRGFGGTMYNVSQALGGIGQQETEAKRRREEALFNLQQSYTTGEMQGERTALDRELELLKIKEPRRRTGFNPITGDLQDMDTGEPIEDGIPTLTFEQVAAASRDPNNRGKQFRTTDGRIMRIK